jgi:hypothetical protein
MNCPYAVIVVTFDAALLSDNLDVLLLIINLWCKFFEAKPELLVIVEGGGFVAQN